MVPTQHLRSSTLKLSFCITVAIFTCCGSPDKHTFNRFPDSVTVNDSSSTSGKGLLVNDNIISLDHFTGFPDGIEGCSCAYSLSESDFRNKEYIFVSGFDSIAFVSFNHHLQKLKLVSSGRDPMTFGDYDHVDVYELGDIKVTVDVKYRGSPEEGEEVWINVGTIAIENNGGSKVLDFYGSCGC